MYCQNCGIENESNAEYCKSCGQPLNVTQDDQPSEKKKRIPKALIWIPLVAVFLVAIGVFGYRHFTGGRQIYEPCTVIAYKGTSISWKETWNKYGDPEESWCYSEFSDENTYAEWKNEYDSKGRMIREEYRSSDQNSFYTVYEYSGNTRSGKDYDKDGELTGTTEATLNDKGLPTRIDRYDEEGNHSATITYEYDNHGYITKIVRELDSNSEHYDKQVTTREYTYKHGHPVSALVFSKYYLENRKTGSYNLERWEFVY